MKYTMKIRDLILFASVFFILFTSEVTFSAEDVTQGQPIAFVPVDRYEFEPVLHGTEIIHDFVIQNTGTAPLEIKRVQTD